MLFERSVGCATHAAYSSGGCVDNASATNVDHVNHTAVTVEGHVNYAPATSVEWFGAACGCCYPCCCYCCGLCYACNCCSYSMVQCHLGIMKPMQLPSLSRTAMPIQLLPLWRMLPMKLQLWTVSSVSHMEHLNHAAAWWWQVMSGIDNTTNRYSMSFWYCVTHCWL